MCTTLRYPYFDDGCATGETGFALAVIDVEVILGLTFCTIGFSIPIYTRALMLDPFIKHRSDCAIQTFNFGSGQAIRCALGMNTCPMKRFDHVAKLVNGPEGVLA